jgi:hypothetical protein
MNSLIYNLVQLSTFRKIGVLKVNALTSQIQAPLDKIKFTETGRVYLVNGTLIEGLGNFTIFDWGCGAAAAALAEFANPQVRRPQAVSGS